jgi:hypothetical protein
VTDGKYSPYDGTKIFWLIFWSVQAAWVALFPGFICKAIFGKIYYCILLINIEKFDLFKKKLRFAGSCMSRLQMLITLIATAGCLATPIVTALVYGMALNNYYVLLASSSGSLIVVIACAPAADRFTGNKLMKYRFFFLFAFAGQINTIYLFIIPRLITAQSQQALGGMGLTIVRLFVHPVVWSITLFFFRTVIRHIGRVKDLTQTCFIIWPLLYSSLYGRFLLLQLDSVGSVVVLNFMFASFHIADVLDSRGSDSWWLSLMYGERAKDAMQATKVVDEMELVNQLANNMMEGASILAASALLSFGGVSTSPGVPPDNKLIWFNAAIQMVTTIVFNFVEIVVCGKFHNLEWRKVYPKSTMRFLSYVMVVLTIGGSRLCIELLLLFCPQYYDDYGILMEQCDKPSLFQVIDVTLANPRKGGAEQTATMLPATLTNGTWIRNEL